MKNYFALGLVLLILLCGMITTAYGQTGKLSKTSGTTNSILQQIKNHTSGPAIWWTGHNGWLIKSGDLLISTDLALEYGGRIAPAPVSAQEIAPELDIYLVTHAHSDHFDPRTAKIFIKNSKCIFVLPESCLKTAQDLGIPQERIRVAKPREPFELLGAKIEPIRAIHGNANFAVYFEANLQDCGYIITIGGKRFLQPGDSVLSEDQLFQEKIDVLFFSPTEHNTYIDNSVMLINRLSPSYILPQHHSTMTYDERDRFWAKGYPAEVKIRLSKPLQDRYHILEQGGYLEIK